MLLIFSLFNVRIKNQNMPLLMSFLKVHADMTAVKIQSHAIIFNQVGET